MFVAAGLCVCLCVWPSQNKLQCVFMVIKYHVTTMRLTDTDVLLIGFRQYVLEFYEAEDNNLE